MYLICGVNFISVTCTFLGVAIFTYNCIAHICKRPCGKESIEVRIIHKIEKERGNSYQKNEEISGRKAHTHINTQKLN